MLLVGSRMYSKEMKMSELTKTLIGILISVILVLMILGLVYALIYMPIIGYICIGLLVIFSMVFMGYMIGQILFENR